MELAPRVKKSDGSDEPLLFRYNRFLENYILGDEEKVKNYRIKIFGTSFDKISQTPYRYFELSIITDVLNISSVEWDTKHTLEQKAEIIAFLQAKNMKDALERHWDFHHQLELEKKASKKNAPKR